MDKELCFDLRVNSESQDDLMHQPEETLSTELVVGNLQLLEKVYQTLRVSFKDVTQEANSFIWLQSNVLVNILLNYFKVGIPSKVNELSPRTYEWSLLIKLNRDLGLLKLI